MWVCSILRKERKGQWPGLQQKKEESMCQEISCLFLNGSFTSSVHGKISNECANVYIYICAYTYFEVERPKNSRWCQSIIDLERNVSTLALIYMQTCCKGQEGFWPGFISQGSVSLPLTMSCPLLSFFHPFSFSLVPVIYIQLPSLSVFIVGAYAVWYSCAWPQDKCLLCSPT